MIYILHQSSKLLLKVLCLFLYNITDYEHIVANSAMFIRRNAKYINTNDIFIEPIT